MTPHGFDIRQTQCQTHHLVLQQTVENSRRHVAGKSSAQAYTHYTYHTTSRLSTHAWSSMRLEAMMPFTCLRDIAFTNSYVDS